MGNSSSNPLSDLLGGSGGGGLLGGLLDATGLPQLIMEIVVFYFGVEIVMKLIDKALGP